VLESLLELTMNLEYALCVLELETLAHTQAGIAYSSSNFKVTTSHCSHWHIRVPASAHTGTGTSNAAQLELERHTLPVALA
jgi:hypothetical protein